MKKIAIVILNFNGEKDTLECLKSLEKVNVQNSEVKIIVVDNGSSQKFKVEDLKVIREEVNLGYSGGNNVGIKKALDWGADYILLLNNDTIVDKDLIGEMVNVAEADEKTGIIAPKIYFEKGFEFHKDRYKKEDLGKVIWYAGAVMDWKNLIGHHRGVDEVDMGQYDKEGETDFASGCCMLIKRKVFEKIGLFDKKYFLYYEDSDFNQRVKRAGFKIMFAPKGILWHKNAGSAGGSGSNLQDYYISRNRLLFGIKYGGLRLKTSLIKESMKLLLNGRKWQKLAVLDFYLGRFGRGSYE
ncbi:MAG: glycosyltransferase family 2 protein [Candidatus Levybacteria bacterium]|nr:glycosyltransferase family 2 protein [Candidatus Levybacteria bacterium]